MKTIILTFNAKNTVIKRNTNVEKLIQTKLIKNLGILYKSCLTNNCKWKINEKLELLSGLTMEHKKTML
jgi:hypothetical protein